MQKHRLKRAKTAARASADAAAKRKAGAFDISMAACLSACLAFSIPASALASSSPEGGCGGADAGSIAASWSETAAAACNDKSIQAYANVAGSADANLLLPASPSEQTALAAGDRFDLRDPNGDGDRSDSVVTSVKLQNPWSSCWSFSVIAACETSILSETGATYEETGMDLSELQLAGSVYKKGGVPKSVDPVQAGEGYQNSSQDPNDGLANGGILNYASTMFASGIGPLYEETVPYANKGVAGSGDDAPIVMCAAVYNEVDPSTGLNKAAYVNLTEEQVKGIEDQIAAHDGSCEYKFISRVCYSGNYTDADGNKVCTDWTVPDELYTSSLYNLENGNILPETRILAADGTCTGTDLDAVKSIQGELKAGRGVSVCLCSDQSKPDQDSGQALYINTKNWAHYTYETASVNHGVTIVGYDNSYSKDNFGGGDAGKQPQGDGAWLVKNSWGSSTETFPNKGYWGIEENGENTGYFWLSYYDKSVTMFESFDFDTSADDGDSEYYIDQYDYLPQATALPSVSDTPVAMANIFTATQDISLSTVSCATYKPNTKVRYEVYLLDDEAGSPVDPDHAKLACTTEATYAYGGYHRTRLDGADWVAMREGQRYSVVTTQQCLDDGKYYAGVSVNAKVKPTDAQVAKYREDTKTATREKYYNMYYLPAVNLLLSMDDPDTGEKYTREKAEKLADEEVRKILDTASMAKVMEKEVDAAVDVYANTYFQAVVNEGESWTGAAKSGGDASQPASQAMTWEDWTTEVKAPIEEQYKQAGQDIVADNAPVKAFAKMKSWASVAELERLSQALAAASEALSTAKTSVDGSDVDASQKWMTQDARDALGAAVEEGAATLALAGGDYRTDLANTTPDSETVNAAAEKLAFQTFDGTMQQEKAQQEKSVNTGAADADKAGKAAGQDSDTGDETAVLLAVLACAICAAALIAVMAGCARRCSRRK